jgi:4-hydroxybenzoyl-CoA thioesterase
VKDALLVRIYLEDTDAGGIAYHTTYLRLMERARTEILRAAGIQQSESFKQDLSFVLHSMTLRFHTPALLDDEVAVSCALTGHRGASLTFKQTVHNARTSVLHCSAEVIVACISLLNKRPRRIPAEITQKLVRLTPDAEPNANSPLTEP